MFDKHETAVLRGFDTAVADIGDQLHICHPLLSFEGDPNTLYVARRLNWRNHQRALAVADPSEASELATLLPDEHRQSIASGEAAVVAGAGFIQAAADAGIQLDGSEVSFVRTHESGCWITTATQALFAELRTRLVDEARTEFDKELGNAAGRRQRLSERGNAALFLLRRCGPLRREDLAIRQLAGARQNCEFDLYRRLLVRFELELETQKDNLHREVEQHIKLAAQLQQQYTVMYRHPAPEKEQFYSPVHKVSAAKTQPAAIWKKMQISQHMSLLSGYMTEWQTNVLFTTAIKEDNSWSKKSLESHKPMIDFPSFDMVPLSVSEKGVADTAGYREAICP